MWVLPLPVGSGGEAGLSHTARTQNSGDQYGCRGAQQGWLCQSGICKKAFCLTQTFSRGWTVQVEMAREEMLGEGRAEGEAWDYGLYLQGPPGVSHAWRVIVSVDSPTGEFGS